MKTSLGIWALGPMVTRFVPGGYKPEFAAETTAERVGRAVTGLGDLIDGYEFHYPQELNEDNLDGVRDALAGHDIYCMATGLHLDPRFGRGGLVSPDKETRKEAVRRTLAAIDFAGELRSHFIIWPGIEGYNYPFQTPYKESWAWLIDGIGQAAERCKERGILLFLEHKNSEPAMKIHMGNVGMTLHVIHKLRAQGLENVKVNMDWQHLIMNGENLAEYAALCASEGVLGHQHANSGWGTFDDDNMVGATAFMETLELAIELRRAGYGDQGERLGFDLYPYTEDAVAAVTRSVLQWRFIDGIAAKIDDGALREAQMEKDAVRANELVYQALGGEKLVLHPHGTPFRGRAVERLDRTGLSHRVLAAQGRLRLTSDGVAHVLELEAVRVGRLYRNLLHTAGRPELDHRPPAMPGIVEEERTLLADRLQLVALRENQARVELRQQVAREAHRSGEELVDAAFAEDLLAVDLLRPAPKQP
jgi:xylose isomerase